MANVIENLTKEGTSRRNVLVVGGALALAGASGGALSSCSPSTNVLPAVIDEINKVISSTCSIVPVVATLVDIIVTVFPQAAGVAAVTDTVAKEIATFVCGLIKQSGYLEGTHPDRAYKATLNGGKNVDLHFYSVVNGKLVYV